MPLSLESGPLRAYQDIGDLAGRLRTAHPDANLLRAAAKDESQTPAQHAEHTRHAGCLLAGVATKKEAAGIWPMVHRP
jgi:hypothetical protein